MTNVITCPECDAKLKLTTAIPPGKKVKCPRCSTPFVPLPEEPEVEVEVVEENEEAVTTVRKGRRNAVADDREEEEDERPRRRKAVSDEEDSEEPTRDERPRRRRSTSVAEEDSEEPAADERPRRSPKKKRRQKSGSLGLILGLSIGGGVLVLLVAVGVVVAIVLLSKDPYKENETAAKEMVACLEELASTMETVKDRNTAKTAAERINKICDRLEKLGDRVQTLPKLTQAQNDRLEKEIMPQINAINQRMLRISIQAAMAAQGEPTFVAAGQRLQTVGTKLQQLGKLGK